MLSTAECRRLLDACLRESGAAQVRERLKQARSTGPALPLLDRNLVRLGCDSQSKEEALRDAIDLLYAAGRTEERDRVEEVVWQREAVYSTGLGFGVAVPHCKTDAMRADSIAVLGLGKPVAWGAVDDEPVRLVILLAIRAAGGGNRHLQVFSKLARRLMDAGFRERLLEAEDQDALVSYLRRELDLGMA
jgi:fructose-specific PTS system IIA-like component